MPEEQIRTTVKRERFLSDLDPLTIFSPLLLAWKLAKRLFARLFGDGWIVRNWIFPARGARVQEYRQDGHPAPFKVKAADGAVLDTIEFKPAKKKRNLYIIHFLGNTGNYEALRDELAEQAEELGVTVIAFNYRGVQNSEGPLDSIEDLINDGVAQVERLLTMDVDPEDIVLCGHSLGGLVGNGVGAFLHKHKKIKVNVFNDRSTSSLADLATGLVKAYLSEGLPIDVVLAEDLQTEAPTNVLVLQRNLYEEQCKLVYFNREGRKKIVDTFAIDDCDVAILAKGSRKAPTGFPCYFFQKDPQDKNKWLMGFCNATGKYLLNEDNRTAMIVDTFNTKEPGDGQASQQIAQKLAELEEAAVEDQPAIIQTIKRLLIKRRQHYEYDVLYSSSPMAALVAELYQTPEAEKKQAILHAIKSEMQMKLKLSGYWSSPRGRAIGRILSPIIDFVLSAIGWGRNSAQDFLSIPATHSEYMLIRSPKDKREANLSIDDPIMQHSDASLHAALKQRRLQSPSEKTKNAARKFQVDGDGLQNLHGRFYPDELKNRKGQTPTQFLGSFLDQIGERNKAKKQKEEEEKKQGIEDKQQHTHKLRPGHHQSPEA